MPAIDAFKIIPFGKDGGGTGQFGSGTGANGSYGGVISTDPNIIQQASAWLQGYANLANTDANGLPYAEDHTGIWYVITRALEYIQTSGIGEYIDTVNYRMGAIVADVGTSNIYISKIADNIGNALTDSNSWASIGDLSQLHPIATTGSYTDLLNTPTIPDPQVNSDWNSSSGLSQILNKPTNLSQFNNDAGYVTIAQSDNQYRYCVNSCTVDANGYADFITKIDNSTIGFDFTVPIRLCYPDGTVETCISSQELENSVNNTVDGTFVIIKEKNSVTPIVKLLEDVVEDTVPPASPNVNSYFLDISVFPYIPKKYNGTVWENVQFVKLGQYARISGVIATPLSYSLNGRQTVSATYTGGYQTVSHSVGYKPKHLIVTLGLRNINTEHGFTPGEFAQFGADLGPGHSAGTHNASVFNNMQVGFGRLNNLEVITTSNTVAPPSFNNWEYVFCIKRSF